MDIPQIRQPLHGLFFLFLGVLGLDCARLDGAHQLERAQDLRHALLDGLDPETPSHAP
jgi:hypothetical protein